MENTNNESLKGVRILRSFYEALDEFTYEEKGRMFEAIMEYGLNGVEPNFDDASDARALIAIWKTYLPIIDNSINRAIVSAKNGNKGGAPKKSNDVVEPSKTSTQNKATEATIPTQPIPEVQVEEKVAVIKDNEVKTVLTEPIDKNSIEEKFNNKFKFINKGGNFTQIYPPTFNEITKNKYEKIINPNDLIGIMSNDFEKFWSIVEKLENELIAS